MNYREEIAKIYHAEGLFGFTAGYRPMLLRDIISFGTYFLLYDLLKRSYSEKNEIPFYDKMLFGGLSGMTAWGLAFPLDSIKLRMQTGALDRSLTIRQAFMKVKRKEGLSGLMRGVHV